MAIPVSYNLLSAKERWTSSVVAVLGIAGTIHMINNYMMTAHAEGHRGSPEKAAA